MQQALAICKLVLGSDCDSSESDHATPPPTPLPLLCALARRVHHISQVTDNLPIIDPAVIIVL